MGRLYYWFGIVFALLLYLVINAFCLLTKLPPWVRSTYEAYNKTIQLTPKAEAEYFWDFKVQEFDRMLQLIADSKDYLKKKKKELQDTEKHLKEEKENLLRLKKDIESLQKELNDKIITVQQSEQKNIKTLADTYTNMEPEAVVNLFQDMDDHLIVKIISFMPPDALGPILQVMSNQKDKQGQSLSKRAAQLIEFLRLSQARSGK